MTISSRTPEGSPQQCPICGKIALVEPSYPEGDACCPSCGHLLWWFQDRLSRELGVALEQITLSSSFADEIDSLDRVELILAVEEDFDVTIPDEDAEQIKTVADAIRYIEQRRRGSG